MGLLAGWGGQQSVQPVEIGRQLRKAMLADRRFPRSMSMYPMALLFINPADWEAGAFEANHY